MAIKRVRFHKSPTPEESTIIGFSAGASDAPNSLRFADFMQERGYKWRELEEGPEGSASYRHVEVRPPLTPEHIQEFGKLCVGGIKDGAYQSGIVDSGPDGVAILDNRIFQPVHPAGHGVLIMQG